jgi:hypothetical protein
MSDSFGQLSAIGSLELFLQAFAGPANHHCVVYKGNVGQSMNFVLQVIRLVEGLCVLWLQWSGVLYTCHVTATCTVINPALPT